MKSKTLKRVVSLVLVFAFVLTALPFALAADPNPNSKIAADKSIAFTAMGTYPLDGLFELTAPTPFYYTEKAGTDNEKRSKYENFEFEALIFTLPNNYEVTLNSAHYNHTGDGKTFTFTKAEIDSGLLASLSLHALPGAVSTSFTYTLKGKAKYTPLNKENNPDIPEGKTLADVQQNLTNFSLPNPAKISITLNEDGPVPQFTVPLNVDKKDAAGHPVTYYANIPASLFSAAVAQKYPDADTAVIDRLTGIDVHADSEGAVVDSSGNSIGPYTRVDLSKDSNYVTFKSPEPAGKDNFDISYHAVAKINGGDVPVYGTIHLQAQTPTDVEIPEFSRTISSSDKSVIISIDDIAAAAKEARKPENLSSVTIDKITFYFDTLDMSVNFANSSAIEPRVEQNVYNSSTIQVTSKKPTSEVRISYSAHGSDGVSYIGSIVIKGVTGEQVNVSDITKSINASNGRSTMTVADISAKKEVGNKKIVGITFTFSKDDVTLSLGNETVESGKSYVVVNSSEINATSKKKTSDVRVLYEATAEDGTIYKGYILYKGVSTERIDGITGAYSIYVPGSSSYGYYDTSAITGKIKNDTITSFVITNAVFNYTVTSTTGIKTEQTATIFDGSSWSNSAVYGYLISSSSSSSGGVKSFGANERLSYVPGSKAGFVTITFEAYGSNKIYTGTLTYTVYSVEKGVSVTLNLKSRDPYLFANADNEKTIFADFIMNSVKEAFGDKAVCRYVVFDTAQTSNATYGTLYADSNKTALSTRSAQQQTAYGYYFKDAVAGAAVAPISGLYYVPTTMAGRYTQNYSVYVTFDNHEYEFNGTLTINTPSDTVVSPDILYQVTTNTRVNLSSKDFDTYLSNLRSTYTFEYVRLTALPASGTLYYGTTAITASTIGNYSFYADTTSSHASINNVSYVPAGTNYYVTLPFTVYYRQNASSTTLSSREGTIVICITNGQVQDINYTIRSTDIAYMKPDDFISVCQNATGLTLSHVYFTISTVSGGKLTLGQLNSAVNGITAYYASSTRTPALSNVKFTPTASMGTLSFMYSAYSAGGTFLYCGKVNIKLFSETKTPQFRLCVVSPQKVKCNGQAVDLQAYNIDDYNYVKLRDIAALLAGTASRFSVSYVNNATKSEVYCVKGSAYISVGGELPDRKDWKDNSKTCVVSTFSFYVDGEYKSVYVYNIGGNNYFKLRDLGAALNFGVDYDAATNTAIITSADYRG